MPHIFSFEGFLLIFVGIISSFVLKRMFTTNKTIPNVPVINKKEAVEIKNFSVQELSKFNGNDSNNIYVSIKGKIYDVTDRKDFYGPGGAYNIFAGKECARALATMSVDPADVGSADLTGLDKSEIDVLDDWIARFDTKYTHVGYLIE